MLSKHHEVVLSAKSGMRVEEAANHEDPDANVIIMHADTNNLQESTSEVVTEKVLKTLKNMKKNPNVQFQFPLFSEEKLMLPQMVKLFQGRINLVYKIDRQNISKVSFLLYVYVSIEIFSTNFYMYTYMYKYKYVCLYIYMYMEKCQ